MTRGSLVEVIETGESRIAFDAEHVPAGHPSYHPLKPHLVSPTPTVGRWAALIDRKRTMTQFATIWAQTPSTSDERFPFRKVPAAVSQRTRPDCSKVLYTSRVYLYVADASDL